MNKLTSRFATSVAISSIFICGYGGGMLWFHKEWFAGAVVGLLATSIWALRQKVLLLIEVNEYQWRSIQALKNEPARLRALQEERTRVRGLGQQ